MLSKQKSYKLGSLVFHLFENQKRMSIIISKQDKKMTEKSEDRES